MRPPPPAATRRALLLGALASTPPPMRPTWRKVRRVVDMRHPISSARLALDVDREAELAKALGAAGFLLTFANQADKFGFLKLA